MALIAVSFTLEIMLMIVALYLGFDSGFLRQLIAIGFCITGISLTLGKQFYISDLTSTPLAVSTGFPGSVQNGMVIMFSFIIMAIFAGALINLAKFNEEEEASKKLEYLA